MKLLTLFDVDSFFSYSLGFDYIKTLKYFAIILQLGNILLLAKFVKKIRVDNILGQMTASKGYERMKKKDSTNLS
jgi:hypothetical protein